MKDVVHKVFSMTRSGASSGLGLGLGLGPCTLLLKMLDVQRKQESVKTQFEFLSEPLLSGQMCVAGQATREILKRGGQEEV